MCGARTGRCSVRATCAFIHTPVLMMFRWVYGFSTGRQRSFNGGEALHKVVPELFGFEFLFPRLHLQGALRLPNSNHFRLEQSSPMLLPLQPLVSNLCLLAQLLLHSFLGRLRLLQEALLEALLLLQRLLLLQLLLLHERVEYAIVALIAAFLSQPIRRLLLQDLCLLLLLLLQLQLLLLQKVYEHGEIGPFGPFEPLEPAEPVVLLLLLLLLLVLLLYAESSGGGFGAPDKNPQVAPGPAAGATPTAGPPAGPP